MKKICFALLLFVSSYSYSQDLRGGEITFASVNGYTYQVFVTVYSQVNTAVNRKYFYLDCGDGGDSIPAPAPATYSNNIYQYSFFVYHTYASAGVYIIHLEANFLTDSITNLPNSASRPLVLQAELLINPFFTADHSPVFTEPQQNYFPCCTTITDNPGGYDADNDSLVFSLIPVDSGYSFEGATIDSATGTMTFTPPQAGRYLFDIKAEEWRLVDSIPTNIGYVVRQEVWDIGNAAGIEEIEQNELAEVFPSVVQDMLTIKSKKDFSNMSLTITDMQGRSVFTDKLFSPAGEETLHLAFLSAGVYMVGMQSEEKVFVKKILKM